MTDEAGRFVITNVVAGRYDLRITLTGFKTFEQKDVRGVGDGARRAPRLSLDVGGLTEAITVQAESPSRSRHRAGSGPPPSSPNKLRARSCAGATSSGCSKACPGVVDTSVRNAPGWNSFLGVEVNGLNQTFMNLQYDGITNKDTGFGAANYVAPSLDSIAEVKVQASNFQAEYGRAGGANIIVVTKSGTAEFRGSGRVLQAPRGAQLEYLGSPADV